ncbi:MAG: hypothetical protein WCG47_11750 [Dermatophilaceae bacterium]
MNVRAELAALLAQEPDSGERDLLAAYLRIEEMARELDHDGDGSELVLAVIRDQAAQMQAARERLRRLIAYARECSMPAVRLVDLAQSSGISKSHIARYYDQDVVQDVRRRVGRGRDSQAPADPRQAVRQLLRRRASRR